eukprot:TRINITY_DN28193_c0_g2_i1.p1 TRINITY_DN28193_c0_g2~~TRINITY_DN28193_c0_g2_i1.p1  ORF type:complete len:484 (-),score=68.67 TRINITY_DN28193_c0_g2_i1:100-1551(-)
MGCSNSSVDKSAALKGIRRSQTLSRIGLDGEDDEDEIGLSPTTSVERARGVFLDEDAPSPVPVSPRRNTLARGATNLSLSSVTDSELHGKVTFGEKEFKRSKSTDDPSKAGVWITCRKGDKPESPNQDSWCVVRRPHYSLYGVFDGHGKQGHDVSNFVKDNLLDVIMKDKRLKTNCVALLQDAYKKVAEMVEAASKRGDIRAQSSGSTATVIIHDHNKRVLFISHVGDSGAAIMRSKENAQYLTPDHKPNLPGEFKRIYQTGGRVVLDPDGRHYRVYSAKGRGGLNMSRAFGDLQLQEAGVSSEPQISQVKLSSSDEFFVLCSDGVWEFLPLDEALGIAKRALVSGQHPANELAYAASASWRNRADSYVDDITIVLIDLNPERKLTKGDIHGPSKKAILKKSSTGNCSLGSSSMRSDASGWSSQQQSRTDESVETANSTIEEMVMSLMAIEGDIGVVPPKARAPFYASFGGSAPPRTFPKVVT